MESCLLQLNSNSCRSEPVMFVPIACPCAVTLCGDRVALRPTAATFRRRRAGNIIQVYNHTITQRAIGFLFKHVGLRYACRAMRVLNSVLVRVPCEQAVFRCREAAAVWWTTEMMSMVVKRCVRIVMTCLQLILASVAALQQRGLRQRTSCNSPLC